jgi:hypothetical protein
MYSFLLKKALPFTLTFVIGAALGGLLGPFGHSEKKAESFPGTRTYDYGGRCRMRSRRLVAESKPLNIIDVPAAWWSWGKGAGHPSPVRMLVTFGADGTVRGVEQLDHLELPKEITESAKSAARRIRFEPEKVDGLTVTVEKEVEINFTFE